MDLRSIQPGLAAASQVPLFMIHPKTGDMITPLGYGKNGQPWWPVMGGAPDDDDAGGGDDDSDDDSDDSDEDEDDTDEDDDSDEGDDEGKKGKKKGNAQAKIKALEEEKDRHFRKAKKATKRAEAAEAEVAALKAKYESGDDDGDTGKESKEGDKPKTKPVDDSKIKAAEAKAQQLAIENSFLRVNEVDWIKPEQALALMMADDDYDIEFDDDGKVDRKSLKAELKRFAKANPHLVKKPAAKTDDGDDADEGGAGSKSTAPKMNGTRKGNKDKPKTREELAKKFPALNRMSR